MTTHARWWIPMMGAALLATASEAQADDAPSQAGAPPPGESAPASPSGNPSPPSQPAPPAVGWPAPPGAYGWGPPRQGVDGDSFTSAPWQPQRNWYGAQILIPAVTSDVLGLLGAFLSTAIYPRGFPPGLPIVIIGIAGHAFSGPIVHLIHHQLGKAGASFLLEAILPGLMVGGTVLSFSVCHDDCYGPTVIAALGIPTAAVGGLIVDATVLANEDTMVRTPGPSVSLIPLLLPPLGADQLTTSLGQKRLGREMPVGLSLAGKF